MKTVKVAAAIIIHNNQIFATQRGYGEFKDGWEFPFICLWTAFSAQSDRENLC